jgi:hypothetical protein
MNDIITSNTIVQYMPVPEEAIINALLTKYECDYDIGYNYFPNCFENIVDYYFDENYVEGKNELYETYIKFNCPVKFYLFH